MTLKQPESVWELHAVIKTAV